MYSGSENVCQAIVHEISEKKVEKSSHYGIVKRAYNENKQIYTWLDYNQLHYHIKEMKKLPKVSEKSSQPLSQDAPSSMLPNCKSPNYDCSIFADPNSVVLSFVETTSKRVRSKGTSIADVQEKKN